MIDLAKSVRRGRSRAPLKTCIYGGPGVGKTTFAASAPGCVVIPVEEGANQVGGDRLPQPRTWAELLEQLDALGTQEHAWTCVAVDSLGVAEELAEQHINQQNGSRALNEGNGAWGVGAQMMGNEWRLFLRRLEILGAKGIGVLLVAHAQVKAFNDPTIGSYDRYIPALTERTWAQTHRWCDDVLFARKSIGVSKASKGDRARAIFGDTRTISPRAGIGFEAKNRHGLIDDMPLDWSAYEAGLAAFYAGPAELRDRIARLTALLGDEAIVDKVRAATAEAKDDTGRLSAIESRLKERIEQVKEVA